MTLLIFVYIIKSIEAMKNQNWIPKQNEIVEWNGKLFNVISVNMGGKCNLKGFTTTRRFTKRFKDVDISELQPV